MKFLVFLVLFTSCANIKKVVGPDGTEHQLIRCMNIESCYEDATEICGKYQIVNSSSAADKSSNGDISNTHKILVKCLGR